MALRFQFSKPEDGSPLPQPKVMQEKSGILKSLGSSKSSSLLELRSGHQTTSE